MQIQSDRHPEVHDAHVIEIDETWQYMDPSERQYKPGTTYKTLESGEVMKYRIIGGRSLRTPWPGGGPQGELGVFIGDVVLPIESKYMLNVQARVDHMDERGTDLRVLYPSLWTGPITTNPAEEVAICRSYNRWMADIHSQGKGRFRWAARRAGPRHGGSRTAVEVLEGSRGGSSELPGRRDR